MIQLKNPPASQKVSHAQLLHAAVGHIKTAGGQTAQPVIQHANYGIWIHVTLEDLDFEPVNTCSAHLNAFDSR